jgi:nitroimidazol reductase NimA-like FMN-containing flavoprotein (pyridoxamine 5'-phosphate oxidase superfamily)
MITNLKKQECLKILDNNYVGHMSYIYKGLPFIIPITYYFNKKNNSIIGYSGEGHKTKALRLNNAIALEVSEITSVNNWQSVLVHGTFNELSGPDAKNYLHQFSLGVKNLIVKKENNDVNFIREFSSKINLESTPIVYSISIKEMTGKKREPNFEIINNC